MKPLVKHIRVAKQKEKNKKKKINKNQDRGKKI
jgi:hypothetical protein